MMTSANGNIFHVTGHFAGNSPVTDEFPTQRPATAVMFSLISAWINGWVDNREAGDNICNRAHYVNSSKVFSLIIDTGLLSYTTHLQNHSLFALCCVLLWLCMEWFYTYQPIIRHCDVMINYFSWKRLDSAYHVLDVNSLLKSEGTII